MIVLAHRGLWRQPSESNTLSALSAALSEGLGIETDVRDRLGELVISHDPPGNDAPPLDDLLDLYASVPQAGTLALNIKADGLQGALKTALSRHGIDPSRYFVFDMAIPDAIGYLRHQMPFFTRKSEFEQNPAFTEHASGIWLDCFSEDWINEQEICRHCEAGRKIALVSPELHHRNWVPVWQIWRKAYHKALQLGHGERIMLCTDHPLEARLFFDEEN